MNRLIRSEVRKLTSTTWFKVTMVATVLFAPLSAAVNVLTWTSHSDLPVDSTASIHHALATVSLTAMVMLGVGISAMAGEFRHGTIVTTFLVTPRRRNVVMAKLATLTGIGAVVGGTGFLLGLAATVVALGTKHVHHLAGDTGQMLLGALVATALFAALGVAIGALARSTVQAIVGALVWVQLVELALLPAVAPGVGKWLPTAANMAVTHTGGPDSHLLAPVLAAVVLVAWTAALAAGAVRFTIRREP